MVKYSNIQTYFFICHTLVSALELKNLRIVCICFQETIWQWDKLVDSWPAAPSSGFLHLLGLLAFVSFHHAVAGEYDLVTMLISPILYRFVTLFLKEMLHSNLDNVSEIR